MWVIFARAPPPDAWVWPGRRALAFVDAVAWPVAWATFILAVPVPLGLVGQCVLAYCGAHIEPSFKTTATTSRRGAGGAAPCSRLPSATR